MLWDEGTWEPVGDADAGLSKGDLKFILHGRRLRGQWVLVRMKPKKGERGKPRELAADQGEGCLCRRRRRCRSSSAG